MLRHSWIRNLYRVLSEQSKTKPRRRRSRQSIEALESRLLLTTPTVTSLNLIGAATTNASATSWTATFSESVQGVDPTDFALVATGSVGSTLTQVTGTGSVYTVTVSGLTGNGTLGLNLIDNDSIKNLTNVPLGGVGSGNANFTGQVETLDHVFPFVQSINRTTPASATTSANTVSYSATFSEPMTGVDPTDFTLATTGTIATSLIQVTPVSSSVYTVTISGVTGNGTLGLNLVDDGSIHDLAGNPLTTQNAAPSFANQATFATGTYPSSVTTGDLNGDGMPDLAITNPRSSTVSVLLGNGNGTFKSQQTFTTGGGGPNSVKVADLNGDGKSDLAFACYGDCVSVLLGNGNGTFQSPKTFSTGSSPSSITVGDMNGDGRPDLAVANSGNSNIPSTTISVLLGNGDGTFQPQQALFSGKTPSSIVIGDINNDGKPDLAVTNLGNNTVSIMLGNGNGTFNFVLQSVTTASGPISVTLGDLNADGIPDLAVGNNGSSTVSVLLGNGNGTFQAQQTFATGNFARSLTMGDMNGDGKPDLAVAWGYGIATVSVFLGNLNGTFQPQTSFAAGSGTYSVTYSDFNMDGKTDLVVANYSSNTVSILLGNANGNFTDQVYTFDHVSPFVQSINRTTPVVATTNATSVTYTVTFSEAVTGVDLTDFAIAKMGTVGGTLTQVSGSGSVYTVSVNGITGVGSLGLNLVDDGSIHDLTGIGLATQNAAASFSNQATFGTGSAPNSVTLGDVNGDGKTDLAVANRGGNSVSVLLGNGNGTFASQQTFATGIGPVAVAMWDLNGDGKLDLAVANRDNNSVSVLLGNGNGTFGTQQAFTAGYGPRSITVGDLNGDGKPDLAIVNYGSDSVSVLLGNGNGTFTAQQTFGVGSSPRSIALGDLNGDGKPDLAVANYTSDTVSVLLGNGNGTFGTQQTFATGRFPFSITLGDLNADGRPDLAIANRLSNTVSVLLGNGNGTFAVQKTFATGASPFSVTLADFNGDGKPDLALANYSNNTLSVLLGNGNGTFGAQQIFATGVLPFSVTSGDFNADGKPDLVVANQGGSVSVLLGNSNGNFTGQSYNIAALPSVIAPTASNINSTSATLGGNVSSDGGSLVIERGVVYSLTSINPNPHIGGAGVTKLTSSGTTGLFSAGANGLTPSVGYSFVAYATNAIGTTYTTPVTTFTTVVALVVPTVTTPTAANFTTTSATLGANVTSDGGTTIIERGVVYAPSSSNPNPQIGDVGVTKLSTSGTTGIFTINANNLTPGVVYSYAAYAINSVGTTYTSPASTFATLTASPSIVTTVYEGTGPKVVQAGGTLTSSITALSFTFSENMNAVPNGANSVINPSSWRLTRYGIDVTNQISGITFALDPISLQYVAVVSFSFPLIQGGYQLVARQNIQDLAGRPLDGDANGIPGGDFRINFYVAATVNGTTDVGPWLYQIEDTALSAPGPLATPITSSLLVFDYDSNNWTGATIQISSNYLSDQDVLGFVNTSKITGSWDATTATLTLSGTDTVSNYRAALQNVTYNNTSVTPNTSVLRTVDFQATDGLLASNVISRNVAVLSTSIPAVLSGVGGTGTYFEGDPAITLFANLVVTDPYTVNLATAAVSFTGWQGEDRLEFNNIFALQHTFSQDLTKHTATFTITGIETVDHYQTLLRSVIYWDVSANPVTTPRVAGIAVSDGLSTSNIVSRNTAIVSINSPPTLVEIESGSLAYRANDPAFPPQPISATLLVGDPDSNNLTKATVQITSGYQSDANGNDVLSFTNQLGITGSFNAATGMLTLTGTSSVSNYRTALRSVTFSSSGSAVSTADRTLTIAATDDASPTPATSLSTTRTVTLSTSNLPPALAGIPNSNLSYVRGSAAAAVVPGVFVYDPDSVNLTGATIQITGNYQSGLDVLAATTVTGITQSFNAGTGMLTLSGISSLANYQTVLRSVTFQTSLSAGTLSRTLSFLVNDGLATSSNVTRGITIS